MSKLLESCTVTANNETHKVEIRMATSYEVLLGGNIRALVSTKEQARRLYDQLIESKEDAKHYELVKALFKG